MGRHIGLIRLCEDPAVAGDEAISLQVRYSVW